MVCPSIICPATSAPSNTSILRTSTWHTFSLQSYTSWLEVSWSHGCHLSCSLGNFSYLSLSETFPMFSETWETPFLSSCAFLNLVDPSPWGVSQVRFSSSFSCTISFSRLSSFLLVTCPKYFRVFRFIILDSLFWIPNSSSMKTFAYASTCCPRDPQASSFLMSAALKVQASAPYMALGNTSVLTNSHFIAFVTWIPWYTSMSKPANYLILEAANAGLMS